MIRAVIFDLWGTLIVDEPVSSAARRDLRVSMAGDILRNRGMVYDDRRIEQAFDAAGDALGRVHAEGLDLSAEGRTVLHLNHLDETIADRLDDEGWRGMHEAVLTTARVHPPDVIPGARAALDAVRDLGLPCGLISNAGLTPGFILREMLDRFGLLDALDNLIFSDEVEMSKPSAAIFERSLEMFGIEPQEAVFVGDQPVLDVLGPMAAGLWSVQVGDVEQDGIEPHARIASVADLVPAMRALSLI